ncbi:hypothetical protein PIB30_086595 [Stylosanthes scabra]|uniref:Putative plant transposon protein domain-containing protein n=1 Tax=Stylosanthes scabra TaxID=79078 RepID=A0ABU6STF2_9FABA|nr:hypothetical protein [Stylosanthes scabra]
MEEMKQIKAKQEEMWNNTNRFHSQIRKEQKMLAREIQEVRKVQINQTLVNNQRAKTEKSLQQAVERQGSDISEIRKQLNLWTRNTSAREAYTCWAHQQANSNLSEIPITQIPDLMQTNAEKESPMFFGCLKSDYGASSSSQTDQQDPVPLRTAPPLPNYQPPHIDDSEQSYEARRQHDDQRLNDVLRDIGEPFAQWKLDNKKKPSQIKHRELNPTARGWFDFVRRSLIPSSNNSEVTVERVVLVHSIIEGLDVKAELLITENISAAAESKDEAKRFPFPSIIYRLLYANGIKKIDGDCNDLTSGMSTDALSWIATLRSALLTLLLTQILFMTYKPVCHELMRRLTAHNPTLSDALLTGYGFPIVSVSAILSMWLRNHQSVTYARKRETVITVRGVFPIQPPWENPAFNHLCGRDEPPSPHNLNST